MREMSKQPKVKQETCDPVSERMLISAILHYGADMYHELSATISERDFYRPENKLIFSTIKSLVDTNKISNPDIVSIVTFVNSIDKEAVGKFSLTEYLTAISQDVVPKDNISPFVKKVARLSIIRNLVSKLEGAIEDLSTTSADEPIIQIVNKAERPFIDFINLINREEDTINLCDQLPDYVAYLEKNKPTVRAVKTGFKRYDHAIGGGLITSGFHLIGGRAKSGKSFFLMNVAVYAARCGIPVLYLDTELTETMQLNRLVPMIGNVKSNQLTNGTFGNDKQDLQKIYNGLKTIENKSLYYRNISGKHPSEWLSIARQWIMQKVGIASNGKAKMCLVVLDYIKLMSLEHSGNYAEHQILGQLATDLHNFCVEYDIATLAGVQLNRDGISRDDQGIIAGSDRLIGLCTSCFFLKNKTEEDYVDDPIHNGNKKLVFSATRNGPGLEDTEYINIKADLSRSIMIEGNTNIENTKDKGYTNDEDGELKELVFPS